MGEVTRSVSRELTWVGGEETYYSRLRCAIIKGVMEKPEEEIAAAFLDCYNSRPTRAEPLWFLSRMYRMNNKPAVAYLYARMGLEIPFPQQDILFIQEDVYKWGLLDEVGATAFYANQPHVGYEACKRLVDKRLILICIEIGSCKTSSNMRVF